MVKDHMGGGMTREQLKAYRAYQGSLDFDDPALQARDYEDSLEGTVSRVFAFNPTVVKIVIIGLSLVIAAAFAAPFFSLN